eukprot:9277729-Pyramimonas_sp.AAC.1
MRLMVFVRRQRNDAAPHFQGAEHSIARRRGAEQYPLHRVRTASFPDELLDDGAVEIEREPNLLGASQVPVETPLPRVNGDLLLGRPLCVALPERPIRSRVSRGRRLVGRRHH